MVMVSVVSVMLLGDVPFVSVMPLRDVPFVSVMPLRDVPFVSVMPLGDGPFVSAMPLGDGPFVILTLLKVRGYRGVLLVTIVFGMRQMSGRDWMNEQLDDDS